MILTWLFFGALCGVRGAACSHEVRMALGVTGWLAEDGEKQVSVALEAPYCGHAPNPADLAARWNLDPRLLAGLMLLAATYLVFAHRSALDGHPIRRSRWVAFAAGWALTLLALTSPLCALSVSLFSARVGQHMVLTLLAAPLVAFGLAAVRTRFAQQEIIAAGAFALALWVWHSPVPYAATFSNDWIYWAMHLTTWGAAVAFWWTVLRAGPERVGTAIAATVAVGLQMALLGAVITWASRPLYAPHFLTTVAWGLTPLGDQQLGGALMWAPGGVIFMVAIVAPLAVLLKTPRRAPTRLVV